MSKIIELADAYAVQRMRTSIYSDACTEARAALKAEAEKLEADAKRYRWLRDKAFSDIWIDYGGCYPRLGLDAAIDKAMEATNEQGI